MVGGHRGDFHRQLATVGAEQQVVEAVPLATDQHQQAGAAACIVKLPGHRELLSQHRKGGMHALKLGAAQIKVHAQEEAPALLVTELLGIEDVAAGLEQQAGDAVDNPGAIRAGQGQDVIVMAHPCRV